MQSYKEMNCKELRKLLFDYAEVGMADDTQHSIRQHAEKCTVCNHLILEFKGLNTLIDKEKKLQPNPFATTRILQHITLELEQRQRSQLNRFRPLLQPALITLSLFVALFTGFIFGRQEAPALPGELSVKSNVENLKSELFIHDFIDEDKTLIGNK